MGGRGCNCPPPPKFLADYLTLSQPGAAPPHYYVPNPQIFRPLYSPVVNFVCNPLSLSQVYDNFHSSESRLGSFWATYVLLRLGLILAPDISARHFGMDMSSQGHFGKCMFWPCGRTGTWAFCLHGRFDMDFLGRGHFGKRNFWHNGHFGMGYFGT